MTDESQTLVTVLIPALNEEGDIAGCIEAVGRQTHPLERIQLIVVDGDSEDRTVEEVRGATANHSFAEVIVERNPRRRTSIGLNIGLRRARGEYVARVDARSRIAPDYITQCLARMADARVGVVGGAQVAQPRTDRPLDVAIARALRNRWATGLSRYRRRTGSGPSDTVWMGFFRTEELRTLDGWPEALAVNEDFALNQRYRKSGKLVWFESQLSSGYLPRQNLRLLARQYFCFGRAKGLVWVRGQRPLPRHLLIVGLPLAGAGLMAMAWCRVGRAAVLLVPVGLFAVEVGGSDGPATVRAHVTSTAPIAILIGSWWIGVLAGAIGELADLKRDKRSKRLPRGA